MFKKGTIAISVDLVLVFLLLSSNLFNAMLFGTKSEYLPTKGNMFCKIYNKLWEDFLIGISESEIVV